MKKISIVLGVFSPLAFIFLFMSRHNGIDMVVDYSPLRLEFLLVLSFAAIVLISSLIDLILKNRSGRSKEFPGLVPVIISWAVIILMAGFSAYLLIPQFIVHGNVELQILMTGRGNPGLAVSFWTEKQTANVLKVIAAGKPVLEIKENKPAHKHWFELKGLEAGKSYTYSINGEEIGTFKTPNDRLPLHFAAAGDPHFQAFDSRTDRTIKIMEQVKDPKNNFSMFFLLGDTVQIGCNDAMWKQAFKPLSVMTSVIPTFYVIGNHDTLFGGARFFKEYVRAPRTKNFWQRIDLGKVHFLALDVEFDLNTYSREQEEWLIRQLSSIPRQDWCVVMSHTFYYCSGRYEDGWNWYDNKDTINKLVPLFEKYGVDLVLSGHKHHSEVLKKNGITYAVMGTFGGILDPEREYISPASVWYQTKKHGFADVKINNEKTGVLSFRDDRGRVLYKTVIQNH